MNIDPITDPEGFENFLFESIDLNSYKYKYLNDFVNKVLSGEFILYESSLINIGANGWIIVLHSEALLVYGENWKNEQINEISEKLDLNVYTNYTLTGDHELIDQILQHYQIENNSVLKRRLFYRTEHLVPHTNSNVIIRPAQNLELEELSIMLQQYYHEEYNGLNDKTLEEMRGRMSLMINNEMVYILISEDGQLASFCTIINPDIGILFTKEEFRNRGFGRVILYSCAKLLFEENGIVYLMTDRDCTSSNRVSEHVGFTPYFKWLMAEINIQE
jgi:GNAT superfamily N-acetyltransferase